METQEAQKTRRTVVRLAFVVSGGYLSFRPLRTWSLRVVTVSLLQLPVLERWLLAASATGGGRLHPITSQVIPTVSC